MKETLGNKEKIFFTAVRLFAQKRYHSVTMREIAQEVGIKAASIYNHYESKEALLEAIVEYFRASLCEQVYPSFEVMGEIPLRAFLEGTIQATDDLFTRPILSDISRIIVREQFASEQIRLLLLEELIQKPRQMFAQYFSVLMQNGKMRKADPILAAKEYHAYFIYRFYENSLMIDSGEPDFSKDLTEHNAHLDLFIAHFCL